MLLLKIVLLSFEVNVSLLRITSGLAFEGFNTFKSLKEFVGSGLVTGWRDVGRGGWGLEDSVDDIRDWEGEG